MTEQKPRFEVGAIKPIEKVGIQQPSHIESGPDHKLDTEAHSLACPNCGEILDGAGQYSFSDEERESEATDGQHRHTRKPGPEPGCPSVCCKCGQLLYYDGTVEHLTLRAMTDQEFEEIKKEEPTAAQFLATARKIFLQRAGGMSLDDIKKQPIKGPTFWN